MNEDLWKEYKANRITENDIDREFKRFWSLGIPVKQEVAAAAALRAKKMRGML